MKSQTAYLVLILTFATFGTQFSFSQDNKNPKTTKNVIDYYNRKRIEKKLPVMLKDTLLNNVCKKLIMDSMFRNKNNFKEDAVRLLLHNTGITDYQYELLEVSERDTVSAYRSFLLNDVSGNLRVGYSKMNSKTLLIKTRCFLKFDHWEGTVHSQPVDLLHNKSKPETIIIFSDSTKCYMKTLIPGRYSYYTSEFIPLKSNKPVLSTKKPSIVKPTKKSLKKNSYDLIFTTRDKECDKYLVIVNEKNERVAVFK